MHRRGLLLSLSTSNDLDRSDRAMALPADDCDGIARRPRQAPCPHAGECARLLKQGYSRQRAQRWHPPRRAPNSCKKEMAAPGGGHGGFGRGAGRASCAHAGDGAG